MTQSLPTSCMQWNVTGRDGPESLIYSKQLLSELGDCQVLIKIQGASLNFRDIMISRGDYPWSIKPNVVPGSDGAGTVIAVGKHVTRFKVGDRVATIINQQFIAGPMTEAISRSGLGAELDGTFRTVGTFDEQGLVLIPQELTFVEGATLSCAGVTAWNALFGSTDRKLSPGQWLLTLGTGAVSLFALQLAKSVGARVIATTSSDEKAEILHHLGADHIINYRQTPEWGSMAKSLTGGVGVDHVLDVAGSMTLKESAASVKIDGTIVVMGSVGGLQGKEVPTLLDAWIQNFTVRGIWTGSRQHMEDMCRAIEGNINVLHPVIDPRIFKLHQLKEAYAYLEEGKHQGKCLCRD